MPVRLISVPAISQLSPIVKDLGRAVPVSVTDIKGGTGKVFRIDLADGSALVLRTYDDVETGNQAVAGEVFASRLLERLDLPVTRYLVLDTSGARLPFPFALTNHLSGQPVSTFSDVAEASELHRQMGELLRRLHTIGVPAFGHFHQSGIRDPVATNAEYMRQFATHAFRQFRHYAAEPSLASRLERIVADNADLFAQSRGPVFCHDDLHPNNVLAERDRAGQVHVSGLVDLGNSRAADPLFDLAKTLFICEHDAPGSSAAIRAGYGPVEYRDSEATLWLYTLLHRVVMWWWLRHVGATPDETGSLVADLRQMAEEGRP